MFECMEITESIYEGVVEPSYKKLTQTYSNRAGHIRQKIYHGLDPRRMRALESVEKDM